MAYQKINRRRYRKKKRYPLLTAFITILFCIGISLGLAALWQNQSQDLSEPLNSGFSIEAFSSAPGTTDESGGLSDVAASASSPAPAEYDYSQPVPESDRVTSAYFDDALFVGDSITAGIQSYALMKNASVVAFTGINTNTILTREVIRNEAGELETMPQAISRYTDVKKIYVMLGANGIAWIGKESFVENYGAFLDTIRQQHPNADIYMQSILPVTASKEDSDPQFANSKIREYNAALLSMAQEKKYYYLNVAEAFADENGCLPEEASPTDGMHFGPKYYEVWFEYLKNHVANPDSVSDKIADGTVTFSSAT
ncbi:MAG: GDSL-type esterase/lipase family protein [Oscillospiraceae bacterium]|nr:GDSL-type esterase/lipase family protein [Oscillospiraceae bacterium]